MAAIGIDLGTTNSCAFYIKDGLPKVSINSLGKHTTPSVIGLYKKNQIVIGESAQNSVFKYPEAVISGVKYVIGKPFKNEMINNSTTILLHEQKLKYAIKREDSTELYTPEEISAMVLKSIKQDADYNLDTNVTKAVITVPTYFNDSQREATIAAGKIAGFKEIKLLNESIAAAVAYGVEHKISDEKILFVFDFGGGTFDVSILKHENNEFNVLSIDGDLHLGGDDVTSLLVEHVLNELGNHKIKQTKYFRKKSLMLCEKAKITLTNQDEAFVIFEENDLEINISRDKFNKLTNNLFNNVMSIVQRCVENANISKNDIDDILLVGGSSRIIDIQDRLTKYFNKGLKKNINADEVVAQGAAIVASNWSKTGFENIKLNTITAHSIGVEIAGKDMNIVIPRYSKIPIEKSNSLRPFYSSSTDGNVCIYSGEDKLTKNNTYLGNLLVKNITIDPNTGQRDFTATLRINEDGILKITTTDTANKIDESSIILDKENLTEIEIENKFLRLNNKQIEL